ncbi:MAG: hypothetical protein JSS58_04755 [Proteobacteria bacterium]|nr:hypothetical protein [Pseudomonadota bacterium]
MKAYACALLLLGASLAHAESALTKSATDLMAQAQSDAAKVASLPENTKVDILRKVGAWSEVKTSAGKGWVRMFSLKPESAGTASSSGSFASGMSSLLNAGRTSNSGTETTGVKGLTKEDLARAQPNPNEFLKMQRYAVSKEAGRAFAQRTKLSANHVDYLPDSFVGGGSGGDSNNNNNGTTPGMMGM